MLLLPEMPMDPDRFRLRAARCRELAAALPPHAPAAEQLRIFAADLAEMAVAIELTATTVLIQKPPLAERRAREREAPPEFGGTGATS